MVKNTVFFTSYYYYYCYNNQCTGIHVYEPGISNLSALSYYKPNCLLDFARVCQYIEGVFVASK